MKPTVGRVVHYVSHGTPVREDGTQAFTSKCRAATVTEVGPLEGDDAAQADVEGWDEERRYLVGLAVLNPTGLFFHPIEAGGCIYDAWDSTTALEGAQPQGGTWHWPERETGPAPLAGSGAG